MHNGQIGGFEKLRRRLEGGISDALFDQRQGTTDSELVFLLMLDEGLESDPEGALGRATARIIEAARRTGMEPSLKLTAAFADGESLYAVRFATDKQAPTLYTAETRSGGRCIVSEPFDRDGGSWQAIPPSSFVTITSAGMSVRPFAPRLTRLALAG
jgi:glutamine amidotransferase